MDIPVSVKQAELDGLIQTLGGGLSTMRCVVCNKNMDGVTPAEQHLKGSSHKEALAKYAIRNRDTAPHLLSHLLQLTRAAVLSGVIQMAASGSIKCTVCDNTLTGTRQIEDHLAGNDHRKKSQSQVIVPRVVPTYQARPIQPQPNPIQPQPSPIQPQPSPIQPQPSPFQPQPSPFQPQPSPSQHQGAGAVDEDGEITQAMEAGHIRYTDNASTPYSCLPCGKHFNGRRTLCQHLGSNTHKKKTASQDPGAAMMQPTGQNKYQVYNVRSSPRGLVHVFNNKFVGQRKLERLGAEHDSTNLRTIFNRMGYSTHVHDSLNFQDTMAALDNICRSRQLNDVDSLIFFFLTHGKDPYTFYTNNNEEVNLFSIRGKFTDSLCPAMQGKPKIFFMNYCRGENMEERTMDGETPDDMVTIHAAAEGIMAYRSPNTGTHFVDHLCQVLTRYSRSHDLRDIYNILRDEMKERGSTRPMWEDYGFKTFFFRPV